MVAYYPQEKVNSDRIEIRCAVIRDTQPIADKPVLIQSASPGKLGGVRAQIHLRQILGYFDARILNKPEAIIGDVSEKVIDGVLTDESTRSFLSRQLSSFATFATK